MLSFVHFNGKSFATLPISELDAGSPADGIAVIEERVGKVYAALGAKDAFRSVRYAHTGHVYTPAMRKEMLAWFEKWLK